MPGLPDSWAAVCEPLAAAFRRRATFGMFLILATGMVARRGRHSVVGMLSGAGMAGVVSFHAACRFFSQAVWDKDKLGLLVARLVVEWLLPAGAPLVVVVDDTLFHRWGRKVHHVFWTHDGAAQGAAKLGRGNRWIIAGLAVTLPFCTSPVCLPVLFRLWAGKGSPSPVTLAGELLALLTAEFPERVLHGVGDAAYHGGHLRLPGTSWTSRLPANAGLYGLAPPRTGMRGRPRLKGAKLGTPADLARQADWRQVTACCYGQAKTIEIATVDCLWYGSFGNIPGRCVLVRDPDTSQRKSYELALFSLDITSEASTIVERYATRWSIEPANATSKQHMGVGQARNRLPTAVERTVPFGMLVQSLVIIWYTCFGYHPEDIDARRAAEPWYGAKVEPWFQDMITKLRKSIITARISPDRPAQPDPEILRDYALACAAAAA
jgi:hypothetical protein